MREDDLKRREELLLKIKEKDKEKLNETRESLEKI